MSESCPVCGKEYSENVKKCDVCGFADEQGINRGWPIAEDAQNWIDTVVKPYREQWEKEREDARKKEAEQQARPAGSGNYGGGSGYTPAPAKKTSVGTIIWGVVIVGLIWLAGQCIEKCNSKPKPAKPISTTVTQPTQPAPLIYKIGDRGPAGGIVFYDKGNYSDGWRYLEAAPLDLQKADWVGETMSSTWREIGSGKENTQKITAMAGTSYGAAQSCKAYILNGYNDWFLPSSEELNLLYRNLKNKNWGSFSNDWYWSSSEKDGNYAWAWNFKDGSRSYREKNNLTLVRPVRQF